MPQCICGEYFSVTSFDPYSQDNDICPKCKASSTPRSYISSYYSDCEGLTSSIVETFTFTGSKDYE